MAGIDVKMGVSGLSEFKNNLNAAKNSLKTMDAQLQLTEKEFKATGDAEKYLQDKAIELNAKLEMQKTVLKNAEGALEEMTRNGVDKGSKAFQDMQQNVLKAKSAMIDTQAEIDKLGTESTDAAKEADKMNTQLERIGSQVSFETVHNGLKRITDGMEKAAKAAYKVGKAVVQEVLGAGSWADDLLTTASVLGVSPDELQRMQKTANLIDTDAETIIKARQKLMKGVGSGSKSTMDALSALGISYSGDAEDAFWKAGEAIMKLGDEAEQEAKANAIFGKSWHDLLPLFTAGREEYEKMNESWKVLSDEQLSSLGKMDDEYQKLKANIEELKLEALSMFAEPMAQAMESINSALTKFSEWIQSDDGKAFTESVIGKVQEALMWLTDPANIETIKGAAIAIGGAWAAMKVGSGVTSLLQLINGFKWLKGNPDIPIPGVENAAGAAGSAASGGGTAAAGAATGKLAALGGSGIAGIAGLLGIPAAFMLAANQRINHAEEVRGTDENLQARTAGVDTLLADYINANKEMEDAIMESLTNNIELTDAEVDALQAKIDETNQKLREAEGGAEALQAYSDWRQERSMGNEDWEMPDWLSSSADKMEQAAAELTGGTAVQKQSSSELTAAAGSLKWLPSQMIAAIRSGMAGVKIYLNGQSITDYVSQSQAQNLFGYVNP